MRWLEPLVREGYGIVAAEYRGYSGNPGTASGGMALDADAFFARARELTGKGKLIVIGHRLGAGVAFGLTVRQGMDALVTIGAFTRLAGLVPEAQRGALAIAAMILRAIAAEIDSDGRTVSVTPPSEVTLESF
jgi:pimeloyl-ACP methyl ester carboxylesterase